jgi:hypothetical protein
VRLWVDAVPADISRGPIRIPSSHMTAKFFVLHLAVTAPQPAPIVSNTDCLMGVESR